MPSIDHQLFCGAEFCDACKGYFLDSNNEDPEEIFFPSEILMVVTLLVDKSLRGALDSSLRTGTWKENNNASTLKAKLPNWDVWMILYHCHI